MPTNPKRDTILEAIVTALRSISKTGGYWNDIEDDNVSRRVESITTVEGAEMPFLVVQSAEESFVERFSGKHRMELQVFIIGFVRSDTMHDADTDMEKVLMDVKKVLIADIGLGSEVLETTINGVRSDLGVVAYPNLSVFVVEVNCLYDALDSSP